MPADKKQSPSSPPQKPPRTPSPVREGFERAGQDSISPQITDTVNAPKTKPGSGGQQKTGGKGGSQSEKSG